MEGRKRKSWIIRSAFSFWTGVSLPAGRGAGRNTGTNRWFSVQALGAINFGKGGRDGQEWISKNWVEVFDRACSHAVFAVGR
jgi:hypothetical protein